MRTKSMTTIAFASLLALSGCSGSASDNSEQPQTEDTSAQSSEAPEETPSGQAPTEGSDDSTSEGLESADDSADSTLTLDTGEKTVTIEPTDVYCSGKPGKLHHIIGKTDNELPLVKAEGTDFVMVKVGQGRPYKANNPSGVTVDDKSVTFDGTELGSATLDGTMTCTDWED
jgi:ABC-type Fe3+-hydroxamate transport system substrate-binding protein